MEYTTEWALVSDKSGHEEKYLIILQNGIPMVNVNTRFIVLQKGQCRPRTTEIYDFCRYLNYLSSIEKVMETATQMDIYSFLSELYIEENKSYENIRTYCKAISKVYECYATLGFSLDESIYRDDIKLILTGNVNGKTKKSNDYITKTNKLIYLFKPKKKDFRMPQYLKWYQDFEIQEISNQLRLAYRCIYLISIYSGFRVDSILSITLDTVSLKNGYVKPTRTKTGIMHAAVLPEFVIQLLETYVMEIRTPLASQTGFLSNYLFLTQNGVNKGLPVKYEAYRSALLVAAKKAKKMNDRVSTDIVHTHAGRSTFLSRIRSYQLNEKRLGHKTLSDEDICLLMDWTSMQCLKNYDLLTRIQELSPFVGELMDNIYDISEKSLLSNSEKDE